MDPAKNSPPVYGFRELEKNNYDFKNYITGINTSIGKLVYMREHDINTSDLQSKLCRWVVLFFQKMGPYTAEKPKYFELRPYSYAPYS